MGTDCIKWVGNLQQELDDAKHTLLELNDNIRRIIGRRPDKFRPAHDAKKADGERALQKSSIEVSKFKRRNNEAKSVFNRLSAAATTTRTNANSSAEDEPRPRLTSRVIRELPSRQEVVAAQGADLESRARNRRIFGSLLGTLQKFCQEESRLKGKEQKKADIEKKLEEQQRQERAKMRKERETLFSERKRKQLEIKTLEMKMHRLKEYETWESNAKHLKNFIRTKTKPHIYYKPQQMCKKTEKLLAESKIAWQIYTENRREELNKELMEIENIIKMESTDADDHMENMDKVLENESECIKNEEEKTTITNKKLNREHDLEDRNNCCLDSQDSQHALSSRVVVVATQKDRDSN